MAAPRRPMRLKTAAETLRWLERDVSPRLRERTEAVAHGGTALSLLGLKDATNDVDLGFRSRESFEAFAGALESLGFRRTVDIMATPTEAFFRYENPASAVDYADLRFPTWNSWRLTKLVLRGAIVLPFGDLRVVRPDRDAVFLFKTYPLRERDIDDLRGILDRSPPDEARVIALFDEQDAIHRAELLEETEHEPLINILELRVRFAASVELLGPAWRRKVPRIARHARRRFEELRIRPTLAALTKRLRATELLATWEDVLDESGERLRTELAVKPGRPRGSAARTPRGSRGRRPPGGIPPGASAKAAVRASQARARSRSIRRTRSRPRVPP